MFGHSLIHHEFQVNPTPSQETSVPHWMHFLAQDSGNSFKVSGQYGFLAQHADGAVFSQWYFDHVESAWDSEMEPFEDVDFNNIVLTPANFVQWQGPAENIPGTNYSVISATEKVIQKCLALDQNVDVFIYENWPDMAPFLTGFFPPDEGAWSNYNTYLNGDFHDWFLEYYESVKISFPNVCIKMIPVGPVISRVLDSPPFDQIPLGELYEDDAPHGRPTLYFIASIITYAAMYEELPSKDFSGSTFIHPIVLNNLDPLLSLIWQEMIEYEDIEEQYLSFCNNITQNTALKKMDISIFPNPVYDQFYISGLSNSGHYVIKDFLGRIHFANRLDHNNTEVVDVSHLPSGLYILEVYNRNNKVFYSSKILKL